MQLNSSCRKNKYTERIIQFGEGNFLRAFVDNFVHIMNEKINYDASVVVIQPIKEGRVQQLNDQDGLYTLYLNGVENGNVVREKTFIESISRGINPYKDYNKYIEVASNPDIRIVFSNTTEAGIAYNEEDTFNDEPQSSFPGKVTRFLYERYKAFKGDKSKGLIFIPCELIENNGQELKKIVLEYAKLWDLEDEFVTWIEQCNVFCNSLVDRIVPGYPKDRIEEILKELGYNDTLVDEGEKFHLWVIEGPNNVKEVFPADKAGLNVIFTDDLTPYRTRKVRILNGAHTSMVPVSLLYGLETVKETVEHDVMGRFVNDTIFDEIIPTLDLSEEELNEYAKAVLDRFKNPYIKHMLISIALNSNSKYETRVLPSLLKYTSIKNKLPRKMVFSLAALIMLYRGNYENKHFSLKDDSDILQMYSELWNNYDGTKEGISKIVMQVFKREDIWKMDLNNIKGLNELTSEYLYMIEHDGIRKAINEVF